MRAVIVSGPKASDWKETDLADAALATLQKLVGGYIEALPFHHLAACVFVNEDGRLVGLTPTAVLDSGGAWPTVIVGPIVILGPAVDGVPSALTDESLAHVRARLRPFVP